MSPKVNLQFPEGTGRSDVCRVSKRVMGWGTEWTVETGEIQK